NDEYYAHNAQKQGHPEEMITDAIRWLGCDDSLNPAPPADCVPFDFSLYTDAAGNIPTIGIIHVGPGYEVLEAGQTQPNDRLIHSHESSLFGVTTWDGKRVLSYHTEPEVLHGQVTPPGVICHETGHALGLPDLYETNYTAAGLGLWSLMSGGGWGGPGTDGSVPTHLDAWSKSELGWVTPLLLTASVTGQRLSPVHSSREIGRIPNGMPPEQYFLLEVRQKIGYDEFLPGAGLAIYHIDENVWGNTLTPDDPSSHFGVDLEQADGLAELNTNPDDHGDAADLFPTATNNAFTPTSTPDSVAYGASDSKIKITGIARDGDSVLFNLAITATKVEAGMTCFSVADCLSNQCADGVCCNRACDPANPCDACSKAAGAPTNGTCAFVTVTCDDGDKCTEHDACDQGTCQGARKICPALDSCHETSVCIQETGLCSELAKPEGTGCEDNDECTIGDTCRAGACVGTARSECPPADPCHSPATCQNKKCGSYAQKPDYTPCDDGTLCTTGDACLRGSCKGAAVVCTVPNDCYVTSTCNAATGTCPEPVLRPEGATCDDHNPCTKEDACHTGQCRGVVDPSVTVCPAPNVCHDEGTCSPTGECLAPLKVDGTVCDNGNKCLSNKKCSMGECVGTAKDCGTSDSPCSEFECLPASGQCQMKPKAEGAPCVSEDLSPCDVDAICHLGLCQGDPKPCPALDECHTSGSCNRMNGKCGAYGVKEDGSPCTGGSCKAGACVLWPPDAGEPGLDAGESVADAGPTVDDKGGCGCASGMGSTPFALLGALLAFPLRRRRR
ncbi:MAG: M6 family metalloprotease domain-containing protein, partial [Deltaproteobacteria bacterium]|nr:M6 family metalloprotease domain-containing protein [Deltaproteobacteria bacterium]